MTVPPALLTIARRSIRAWAQGEAWAPRPLPGPQDTPRGCFVTLWTPQENLRGCIGHIEPVSPSLAGEVAACAVLAASRDPRFSPVRAEEVPTLRVEISLLGLPEEVHSLDALDPHRFGVIVTSEERRGLLLPGIEGIDSPERQVIVARRKADIPADAPCRLFRFKVSKLAEERPESDL